MKKETILKRISDNKEIMKKINSMKYFDIEDFYNNAFRYKKAIKEGRMFCLIHSVSKTGMSRTLSYHECAKSKERYFFYNFYSLFTALGYTRIDESFRVYGCGMDMNFHTNYTNIHILYRLGFMTKKECNNLSQLTPTCL